MKCKTLNCTGLGKLKKNGTRPLTKGYCNACYQRIARANNNRMAVYYKMLNRCSNPKNDGYKWYGARGITVCDRWLAKNNGFKNFCEDMGERPEGYTLDRIDVDGPYTSQNCRWANKHIQANNKRMLKQNENTFVPRSLRFRGVTFRKYTHKRGKKQYLNKKAHWCASIWLSGEHLRIYCDDRESAIMARLAMEIEFLGDTLDDITFL
jgi:hypothetical protein